MFYLSGRDITGCALSRSEILGQLRVKQELISSAGGLTHVPILWIGLPNI